MKTLGFVVLALTCMIGHTALAQPAPAKPHPRDMLAGIDTSAPFTVCNARYALCTKATCTPAGNNQYDCTCKVKKGWSAGTQTCAQIQQLEAQGRIPSRYYPIKSFVTCPGPTTWAFCLDKVCTPSMDGKTAHCVCIGRTSKRYVVPTSKNTPATCSGNPVVSSASIVQLFTITQYLKTQPELQPHNFEVLNKATSGHARPTSATGH
ncbi:hypothetical protein [Oleiagrimonas sp. MCCC 1A03011]|uniref:hypothetical protein n=1 Tax=Oleiagrimonas sp. MCCC 1A03011 TaxID=1926883 RepID=UPI000DC36001|nr:hypothetical protein [Oleiagrimonas sp. MCCC 1A03011]RAP59547.1 hypothetical protein BTJ49_02530 [Oleiagrimonas sp. MCCC 1A03011]